MAHLNLYKLVYRIRKSLQTSDECIEVFIDKILVD